MTIFIRNFSVAKNELRISNLSNLSNLNKLKERFITQSTIQRSQEYYLVKSPKGENYRFHLAKSKHLVGLRTTRGTRKFNEDRYQTLVLELNGKENTHTEEQADLDNEGYGTTFYGEGKEGQICYFAVFDGHGGPQCADYLTANLHKRIEDVRASDADKIVSQFRSIGGFRPTVLAPLLSPEMIQPNIKNRTSDTNDGSTTNGLAASRKYSSVILSSPSSPSLPSSPTLMNTSTTELTLDQRLTIAFLKIDLELLNSIPQSVGSTASAALIKTLDGCPFWSSKELKITVAHVGDTRVLLCDVPSGNAISLTFDHHPSAITEHDRLRKSGGYIITDSFGAEMFLGKLAITRSMGDSKMKKYGISAEPEIMMNTIKGDSVAFMVLVSDGVTSVLSNQEIVDCIKNYSDPTLGASKLIDLADELGSEDNITAMVVRLPGWGAPMPDHTKDLRKYRLDNDAPSIKRRK
ncbi:4022_t:CDS:2 [Diversispora eburnea]|uniref:4022_t:CDS:1 n=1 Tax=Diversispora eburnea TaxID=1213867 RepID=A0A9N9FVI9_9GLOM|nr:4022_t:CDS:2 [Diversispora eburnea]